MPGHLRHAVVDRALGGAEPSTPVTVAIAGARDGAAFVVTAPHGPGHLGFQRFLDDLPDRDPDQFAPRVALGDALGQQLTEFLACPLRGRYSRLHRDASSCRRRQPANLGFESKSASPSRYPASLGLRLTAGSSRYPSSASLCPSSTSSETNSTCLQVPSVFVARLGHEQTLVPGLLPRMTNR